MNTAVQVIWMFPLAFGLIFLGIPVGLALLVVAFSFGWMVFNQNLQLILFQTHDRLLDVSSNYVLAAIPLFILMGAILERSGLAERLFHAIRLWLGRLPSGLALTTVVMCALLAAASGVVGAVEVLVGMMALPAMAKAGYRNDIMAGTVCAGGSLGTIIPPSVVVIVYASATSVSVGDMMAGVIIPGILMVVFFATYLILRGIIRPDHAPRASAAELDLPRLEKLRITASAMLPTTALILAVLGSILTGIASPTEAGALGATGAALLAAAYGRLRLSTLVEALRQTVMITSAIMLIILGGMAFASVFMMGGGRDLFAGLIAFLDLGTGGMLLLFLGIIFLLGFFLDWVSVILIAIPLFVPFVQAAGIDPVWFGVMVCVVLQTSYLTPPMAPSIFYLRAIAPPEITYRQMALGVTPFVVAQLLVLAVVAAFPWTATYLPSVLFRL